MSQAEKDWVLGISNPGEDTEISDLTDLSNPNDIELQILSEKLKELKEK